MCTGQAELTTFGAVARFAASLEEDVAKRYERWMAQASDDLRDRLSTRAAVHRRRAAQLQRIVQEQLNEMTLEPISGLREEDYSRAPGTSEAQGGDPAVRAARAEASLVRLYEDVAERASRALGSATKTLRRFAADGQLAIQQFEQPQGTGHDSG